MKGARKPAVSWGFPALFFYSNSQNLVCFRLFQHIYLYFFLLITCIFSKHYFSFHIFLIPIQYHCIFSLLCVVSGLACLFFIHRIFFCWLACPPMEIITSCHYFCNKKDCDTMIQMFYKLFSRDCITILLLQISIENHPYYFNNSSSSPTRSHTANLHSTEKRMYHSHLLLF